MIKRLFALLLLFGINAASAQLYYADIQTIFASYNCNGCHGASSGLNVNTYTSLMAGGNSCGPAIIPFDPAGSPLASKIDPNTPNCSGGNMPPTGSVSAAHLASIKAWIAAGALQSAASACADLSISAYVEGSSQNKYLEIYNGTGQSKDLSTYSIKLYSNGNTNPTNITLSGTLAADDYFLVANPQANLPGLTPDLTSGTLNFNGNDAVALFNGTTAIDVFGQIGTDPGSEGWSAGDSTCLTANATWIKIDNGSECMYGNFLGNADFNAAIGSLYTCLPQNDVSQLHTFDPNANTCPTLSLPAGGNASVTACSGEVVVLSVAIDGGTPNTSITWTQGGQTVGTGTSLEIDLGQYCIAQTLSIVASTTADTACVASTVAFTVLAQPQPGLDAVLSNPNECTVCLNNQCSGLATYTVNGGTPLTGNCYTAMPGEDATVIFTVTNECGSANFTGTLNCPNNNIPGTIQGTVWHDNDTDGVFDANEDGAIDFRVSLFEEGNEEVGNRLTDANGFYAFDDVPTGNYYITVEYEGGGTPTYTHGVNAGGVSDIFTLNSGQTINQNVGVDIITSVDNIAQQTAGISPMPIVNTAILRFESPEQTQTQLFLHDLAGKCIHVQTANIVAGQNAIAIDLNTYPAGSYMLSLRSATSYLHLPVVKQ